MGIFDFLRKGTPAGKTAPAPAATPTDKKLAAHAKVVADKRAQTYDRIEAIQALVDMKTPEAAAALLRRFTFTIDPTITDEEEKELCFQGIVAAGQGDGELPRDEAERERALAALEKRRDEVIDAVVAFCEKAEQLTWPLKVLRELLDDEAYGAELVALLERFDTEYARNVEPKVQVIAALEEVRSEAAREGVERFLEDVNETVRFHAVQTTFAQEDPRSVPALAKLLVEEESVRIKNKIAEGLLQRGWTVPQDRREAVAAALRDTAGYALDREGRVAKTSVPRF
jgi:HEAT repeat protein